MRRNPRPAFAASAHNRWVQAGGRILNGSLRLPLSEEAPLNKKLETFLVWLVALVFTIAAGYIIWFLGRTFSRHYEARTWIAVPAEVQNYDLRKSHSRSGSSTITAIQERLVASYTYSLDGKTYNGNQVDFSIGADNFSGSRRREQIAALRTGQITVFVNSEDPQDSVFDRSLPLNQVLFAIVFLLFPCGVGTAFSIGMLTAGLVKVGLTGLERYYLPLLGILHSAPVLYPLIYADGSLSFGNWIAVLPFVALLAFSLRTIWRRIKDPTLGAPRWPARFRRAP
jgi:hypothetical protein